MDFIADQSVGNWPTAAFTKSFVAEYCGITHVV